jgi:hypothetical protein
LYNLHFINCEMSVTSSSSTAALTQLRWQSVRVTEMNLSLESENDLLRKELDAIRSRYASLSEQSSGTAVAQADKLRKSLLSTRRGVIVIWFYTSNSLDLTIHASSSILLFVYYK